MTKFTLDGVEFNSEAEVVSALTALKSQLDNAQQDTSHYQEHLEAMTANRDAAVEQASELKTQLDAALAGVPAMVEAGIQSRIALLESAKAAGVEVKADMSEMDIRKSVILAASPKAELADKADAYILARFDAAVEQLQAGAQQNQQNRSAVADLNNDAAPDASAVADEARARYLTNLTTGWKAGNK